MDILTSAIKNEIRMQYRSVRKFSMEVGIPQSTIVSALHNGIGGTSYDTVLKICRKLRINLYEYSPLYNTSFKGMSLISAYSQLDEKGRYVIDAIMSVELQRCGGTEYSDLLKQQRSDVIEEPETASEEKE